MRYDLKIKLHAHSTCYCCCCGVWCSLVPPANRLTTQCLRVYASLALVVRLPLYLAVICMYHVYGCTRKSSIRSATTREPAQSPSLGLLCLYSYLVPFSTQPRHTPTRYTKESATLRQDGSATAAVTVVAAAASSNNRFCFFAE